MNKRTINFFQSYLNICIDQSSMPNLIFVLLLMVLSSIQLSCQNSGAGTTTVEKPNNSKSVLSDQGSKPVNIKSPESNQQGLVVPDGLEFPAITANDKIIRHLGYSFLYSETFEQSVWVAYELTKDEVRGGVERDDQFRPDPAVATGTGNNSDYSGSGYDRGHLAPAADMGWSPEAMSESFYFSNMSPQVPSFNRGIWKKLEEMVRTWAIENEAVYVVTGPVLHENLPVIGKNGVAIPEYYYKVILDYRQPEIKGIGFIMANAASGASLREFAVPIDSVERFTGLEFFHQLSDQEERVIESKLCIDCWSWKKNIPDGFEKEENIEIIPKSVPDFNRGGGSGKSDDYTSEKVQCSGTTKAGARCRRTTSSPNGRCYQHGGS